MKQIAGAFDVARYKTTQQWCGYVLECRDFTYYAGITKHLERRLFEHCSRARKNDTFTAAFPPVRLVEVYFAKDIEAARAWEADTFKWLANRKPPVIFGGSVSRPYGHWHKKA